MRALKIVGAVVLGYAALMVLLIGAMQFAARSKAFLVYSLAAPTHVGYPVHVMLYAEYRLPFGLGGGPFPGTVKLVDDYGNVVDEDRIDNIYSVGDVRFYPNEERATFTYMSHGRRFLVTLNATD